LQRHGQTPAQLYDALAAGRAAVHWPDFRKLFAELEPGLAEQQLEKLWKRFDKNGDGSVSKEEFLQSMSGIDETALVHVCARVVAALRRDGQTADQLYEALSTGKGAVHWPDFQALFKQLEPHLTEEQLQHLWRTFDKDGDGSVSREEFRKALSAARPRPRRRPRRLRRLRLLRPLLHRQAWFAPSPRAS